MRTEAELISAGEHVYYEFLMFIFTAREMNSFKEDSDRRLKDALLESFTVHFRCLKGFFYGSFNPNEPDDILAIDFFEDGKWEKKFCPKQPESFRLRVPVNKQIVHLTYQRSTVAKQKWGYGKLVPDMQEIMRAFLESVQPSLLGKYCDPLRELARSGSSGIPVEAATMTGTSMTVVSTTPLVE